MGEPACRMEMHMSANVLQGMKEPTVRQVLVPCLPYLPPLGALSFWQPSQAAVRSWTFVPDIGSVEFLRALGSQSLMSVWQHTLVG